MPTSLKISEINLDGKYQFMPDLPDNEFQSLKEDIRAWGIQTPPEIDENYRLLDGWNRIRACQELGISEISVVIRNTGMSEEQKIEHAIVLNIARRQVTNEQKKEIFYKVREEHPEYPLRRIAKILNINVSTASRWNNEWSGVAHATPDQHEGADGRIYPANEVSAQKQREEIRETIEEHPDWSNRKVADEVGASHNTVGNQRKAMNRYQQEDIDRINAGLEGFSDDPFGADNAENKNKQPEYTEWLKEHPEEGNASEFGEMAVKSTSNFEQFRSTLESAVSKLNEVSENTDFDDEMFSEEEKHNIIEDLISDLFSLATELGKKTSQG